jgi:hypothetical protein
MTKLQKAIDKYEYSLKIDRILNKLNKQLIKAHGKKRIEQIDKRVEFVSRFIR